jgi:hypothetical protein
MQWCIVSEGNNQQTHAFASIVGGDRSTWHHNLFAHLASRVPRWGDITVQNDFRNNVLYDWGYYCGYGDLRTLNYVNNFLRKGPSTTQTSLWFIRDPKVALPASIYVNGNFIVGRPDLCQDNWKGVGADRSLQSSVPFPAPPVQTHSAEEAFERVLKNAGATLPKRDSVDARAVSDARDGTGQIIKNEKEVGGWHRRDFRARPVLGSRPQARRGALEGRVRFRHEWCRGQCHRCSQTRIKVRS